ncbi:hypothetical protein CAP36_04740 [Chitinophagaceae bacterium IBVUCB2]|nr:hypothetical protein CAP36_04740 [Chitinophagaceae bacterium IBVUCB2]
MTRPLLLLIYCYLQGFALSAQLLKVEDLLVISSVSPKNLNSHMSKKGFSPMPYYVNDTIKATAFIRKSKEKKATLLSNVPVVEVFNDEQTDYYTLYLTSAKEYLEGCTRLKNSGFYSNDKLDTNGSIVFQKNNIVIHAGRDTTTEKKGFSFLLQKKKMPAPDQVKFAEDLLQFTSHEYLVAFFGSRNVKKDVYYFSETELKQCSVLFPNTEQQAIFIWKDEDKLSQISYIVISGISPAVNSSSYQGSVSQNKWTLRNGIYSSMSVKELWDLNGGDFSFHGRQSEYSFMVPPSNKGNIDFQKTGLTLGCLNCNGSALLDQEKINASEVITHSLAMYVVYIMIRP